MTVSSRVRGYCANLKGNPPNNHIPSKSKVQEKEENKINMFIRKKS